MSELRKIVDKLQKKNDLDESEAELAILLLAKEEDPKLIEELLTSLASKGEILSEIIGAAKGVLKMAKPFPRLEGSVDIVGTGGDGKGTFNVSTLSALTLASGGVPVIKHGNRAASSRCGSADLLESLGFLLEIPTEQAFAQLKKFSFCFLFAPFYHPAFKNVALVRKTLGIRTIFNLLGPLTNPARPSIRLLGVANLEWMEKMAHALPSMGCERAWIVHGGGGTDELTLEGENQVLFLDQGKLRKFTITAEEVGLVRSSLAEIEGGTPNENREQSKRTLQGESGPLRDTVAFNAGVGFYLSGRSSHVREGAALANELLGKGEPWKLVERLISKG